jgi:hypothetical protein
MAQGHSVAQRVGAIPWIFVLRELSNDLFGSGAHRIQQFVVGLQVVQLCLPQ